MASTAGTGEGLEPGVGRRSVPSRPVRPWMSVGACSAGRSRALLRPTCSGISLSLPKAVRREAALWVVFLGGEYMSALVLMFGLAL
jgi:hypothetical protein